MTHRALSSRPLRRRHRIVLVVGVLLAAMVGFLVHPADEAAASAGDEAAFVAALNQIRSEHGLPAFTVDSELADLARGHARVMADAGEIFHANPISAGYSGAWAKLGENVGVGAGVQVLVDAFVASQGHFANIVDPSFTRIGVGVVWEGSALYTTHRFLQPPGSAPPPPAPPPPPPPSTAQPQAPAPAPAAAPSTTTPPSPTTTVPPIPAPSITAVRVIELLAMLDEVGT